MSASLHLMSKRNILQKHIGMKKRVK